MPLKKYLNKLKEKGLKATHQRLEILKYLDENRIHPGIDEIFNHLKIKYPTLSKTTVYNTIQTLTENDLIKSMRFIDSTELHLDYDKNEHYHFICRKCGRIYDVDYNLPYQEYVKISDHKVEDFSGNFRGICKKCLKD